MPEIDVPAMAGQQAVSNAKRDCLASGWARLAAQVCQAPVGFLTTICGEDWSTFGICLCDGGFQQLTVTQHVVGDAAARHVAVRGQALLLADTRAFWCGPDTPPALSTVRALAAAPIYIAGNWRPAAVIGVMDTCIHDWREQHRYGLETLSVAIACSAAEAIFGASAVEPGDVWASVAGSP